MKKDHKKKKTKQQAPPVGKAGAHKTPTAFYVANVVRTKRTQQRNMDRAQKKEVVPLVNRDEELPPPSVVVIMVKMFHIYNVCSLYNYFHGNKTYSLPLVVRTFLLQNCAQLRRGNYDRGPKDAVSLL